jgi:hypothetical protein
MKIGNLLSKNDYTYFLKSSLGRYMILQKIVNFEHVLFYFSWSQILQIQ